MNKYNMVISYDLNKEKDYEAIEKVINAYENIKILETVFIINSNNKSCSDIMSELSVVVDSDDQLFVAEMNDYVLSSGNTSTSIKNYHYGNLFK